MASVKTVNGLSLASMKTRNGLAAASIKTINGLDATTSSSFNPATDSHAVEWLDVPSISASDGTRLSSITVPIGQNFAQATSGNQPIFNTSVQNGLAALTFANARGDFMTCSTFGTIAQPFEIWMVAKSDDSSSNGQYYFDGISGSNRCAMLRNGQYDLFAGNEGLFGNLSNTGWHIFRLVLNGASSSGTIDGGSASVIDCGTTSFVGMTLGGRFNGSSTISGKFGEILVRNATPGDQAAVLTYFNNRWAIF